NALDEVGRDVRTDDAAHAIGPEVPASHGASEEAPQARGSALAELGSFPRFVQAGFLALDDAGVARQEAGALERHAQVRVRLHEGARDAMSDRLRLAGEAAALDTDSEVVRPLRSRDAQRRRCRDPVCLSREVLLERATVDPGRAVAGTHDDARHR